MEIRELNKLRSPITHADKKTRDEFLKKLHEFAVDHKMIKLQFDLEHKCKIEGKDNYANEVDCIFNTIEKTIYDSDSLVELVKNFKVNK